VLAAAGLVLAAGSPTLVAELGFGASSRAGAITLDSKPSIMKEKPDAITLGSKPDVSVGSNRSV
jgi:hypothetical protein